ncbi:MAG: lytic transglycosylase domain-containing protein [Acidimicrobiales bacterium]|nr:lytic transglycosylase domain-containing protein [Acidimicrobiales bacterium]
MRSRPLALVALSAAALVGVAATACAGGERPSVTAAPDTIAAAPSTTGGAAATTVPVPTTTTTAPPAVTLPPAPNGRGRPVAADDPAGLADQITRAEQAIRDPATDPTALPAWGHLQQVAYRKLGANPEWADAVLAATPADLQPVVQAHVTARSELAELHTALPGNVPAWEIQAPRPPEELLGYYREAEAASGILWPYLAAINLVETAMGRIRGLSIAGAQGPMQFMPATWDAYGEGDVNEPRDAILAAGRYLDARGGPGDLWLPVGTRNEQPIPVADFLTANPWSAPPA